jgi:hypothetical protein
MAKRKPVTTKEMLEWVHLACQDCVLRNYENDKHDCQGIDETVGGESIKTSPRCRVVRRAIARLIRSRKGEA